VFGKTFGGKLINAAQLIELLMTCILYVVLCGDLLMGAFPTGPIDTRCQFHQRFMYTFFVWTLFRQLFLVTFWLCWKIRTKNVRVWRWWNWLQVINSREKLVFDALFVGGNFPDKPTDLECQTAILILKLTTKRQLSLAIHVFTSLNSRNPEYKNREQRGPPAGW